ncbi:O-methyltransferase [Algoriphagus pacificus]|uniref:Class I SAM-dependent methyltransferase n=1 Tax=Algoriphagus pacificus TaxID=2811234 RepID=A0ABS3CGL9_9BACT|nr:class I SAM-dependent methyltransferase [Algoriphagus pacificus]MBN7815666.1 class I SAM-dependent methyltransferase [Algoriphagus pacificus]
MKDEKIHNKPEIHSKIEAKSAEIGFTMPSDLYIGSLLKTLVASKPAGHFLELGTGIGLSLSWMIDGMDQESSLISVDNDPKLIQIAREFFGKDERVDLVLEDGEKWIENYDGSPFDLVFADAWPGKYSHLDEVFALLKVGGIYVIDDMDEQPNWPEGHAEKAASLVEILEQRDDFYLTKMNWSTGVILMTKIR